MKCEKCGKYEATTHIHTLSNGVVSEKYLCSLCAEDEGLGVTHHNSIDLLFSSLLGDIKPKETKKCTFCGATFSQITEKGKVGCAKCYEAFRSELLQYIKRVHGSTEHVGNVPNSSIPEMDSVAQLREELNILIKEENYEQAAVVRDKIRQMEAESNE